MIKHSSIVNPQSLTSSTVSNSSLDQSPPQHPRLPMAPSLSPVPSSPRQSKEIEEISMMDSHRREVHHANTIRSRNALCTLPLDPSIPLIPVASLMGTRRRKHRTIRAVPLDLSPAQSFGDSVIQKSPTSTRVFFQNVKGLSSSAGSEDYRYYFNCLQSLQVDVAGLAETNTCWSHTHLREDFVSVARQYYRQNKVVFGSPSVTCDSIPSNESFQAGGTITLLHGPLVSRLFGPAIQDPSGLGRWSGVTLAGCNKQFLTILTAYRVCSNSIRNASLGSAFAREYHHFVTDTSQTVNPRRLFLRDIKKQIHDLQQSGHAIVLMLDANATEKTDPAFSDFISECSLIDLHSSDPAPSTYIGAESRRIDFILGCSTASQQMTRSGTLAYDAGPQSDHRSLYVDLDLSFLHVPSDAIQPTV
jgi:hypothetical protein